MTMELLIQSVFGQPDSTCCRSDDFAQTVVDTAYVNWIRRLACRKPEELLDVQIGPRSEMN
jgi:hypothetical protein